MNLSPRRWTPNGPKWKKPCAPRGSRLTTRAMCWKRGSGRSRLMPKPSGTGKRLPPTSCCRSNSSRTGGNWPTTEPASGGDIFAERIGGRARLAARAAFFAVDPSGADGAVVAQHDGGEDCLPDGFGAAGGLLDGRGRGQIEDGQIGL